MCTKQILSVLSVFTRFVHKRISFGKIDIKKNTLYSLRKKKYMPYVIIDRFLLPTPISVEN